MFTELSKMGFTFKTENTNAQETVPLIEELSVYAKFKVNKAKEMIDTAFAEFGDLLFIKLKKQLNAEQLESIFNEKAPYTRHLKPEYAQIIERYKVDECEFKKSADLPLHIDDIIKEYNLASKYKLSINEMAEATNMEYLGMLTLPRHLRIGINWKEISLKEKKRVLYGQGVHYITGKPFNCTTIDEFVKYHKQKK